MITIADLFCGAGGSGLGASVVPDHQSLVGWPGPVPAVEDCTFRMLEPREIQTAMAFHRDYRVLGTRREQVRQLGNAVTPPAAEFLIRAVVDSLGSAAGGGR